MSYSLNSLTLYLRPHAAIPPYRVNDCANWLVKQGQFKTYYEAKLWLIKEEQDNPWNYKAVMSQYFDATDYQSDYKSHRDVNKYRSTKSNYYGEDPHMWYSAGYTPSQFNEQLSFGIRNWPDKNKADKYQKQPMPQPPKRAPLIMVRKPQGLPYMANDMVIGQMVRQ